MTVLCVCLSVMTQAARSYHILINAQSGTASVTGQSSIEQALENSALDVKSFHYLKADDFAEKLSDFANSDHPVLIGGGDGTISHAGRVCLENNKAFGVLPFGTMNMLAQDLGIPVEIDDMFKAYENTKTIAVDVGLVNDQPFLCCAALGVMPEASRLREETRDMPDVVSMPRLGAFVLNELDKTKRRRIKLTIDGKERRIKTGALVVSNNQYALSPDHSNFQRQSLNDGLLGVYSASPLSFWAKVRLLTRLQFGAWKKDPALKEYTGQSVSVETENKKELISIDGEPLEMETPLNFSIKPKALKIIVPSGGET